MKMQVGDMEMTAGEGIRFDSPQGPRSTPGEPPSPPPSSELPSWVAPTLRLVATAAFLGVLITIVAASVASSLLFLLPLPGLCLLALGAFFLARHATARTPEYDAGLSQVAIERRTRMLAILKRMQRPLSFETLQGELQWTDEAILTTLRDLLANERITEDLNLESGHWVYQLNDEPVVLDHDSPRALPVEERLDTLSSSTKTTQRTPS